MLTAHKKGRKRSGQTGKRSATRSKKDRRKIEKIEERSSMMRGRFHFCLHLIRDVDCTEKDWQSGKDKSDCKKQKQIGKNDEAVMRRRFEASASTSYVMLTAQQRGEKEITKIEKDGKMRKARKIEKDRARLPEMLSLLYITRTHIYTYIYIYI
jgi:hypothetical protein